VRQVARGLGVQGGGDQHAALDVFFDHVPAQLLRDDEGGIQVDRQHGAPLLPGHLQRGLRFLPLRAGAMHEDRNAAELANRLVGELRRALGGGEVGLGEVGAEHLRALLLDGLGHGAADAAPRAGDERPIPLQQPRHAAILSQLLLD
jgi:hypothetical protein